VSSYVRYAAAGAVSYGVLEGDSVYEMQGDLFGGRRLTGTRRALAEVQLLCPCEPTKVVAVAVNYRSHMQGRPEPRNPEIFFKPLTSLQVPGGPIEIPHGASDVHFEGELAVVIGRTARRVSRDEAGSFILGVTCANDVSERLWQHGPEKDKQWWRAKGSDTFCPLGPAVVTGLDYDDLAVATRLNGETVQSGSSNDLIFDCHALVSWVSTWVTLLPGDVILTGTPGTTRAMHPGDVVEVEIAGIGVLRNPIAAAS
jgi:2-keto-4-pentenoate hydratase/2-oxohepta-3-ene-1,7-dioic acid hydratase in catechol pathway